VTNHGGHQRKCDLAIRKRIKKTWANHGGHQPEDLCSMFETAPSPPHERKRLTDHSPEGDEHQHVQQNIHAQKTFLKKTWATNH